MIKNYILLFILLLSFSCTSQIINDDKIIKNAFLSYGIGLEMDSIHFENSAYNKLKSKIKKINSSKMDYFLFNDSVRINDIDGKIIFIPSLFKKLVHRTNWHMEHYETIDYGSMSKNWKVSYEIKSDKKDTIKILGITGFKMIIKENYSTNSGISLENISEIYVSENFNIPFNYYEFLKPKRNFKGKGLILQLKRYNSESPKSYNLYTLLSFNFDKQNKELINIQNLKKIEE